MLRILETTDLHCHLLPYDYYTDRDGRDYGLARTATLIRAARAEADNVLLFDNGDVLQGSPLADIATHPQSNWSGAHPAILAMNALGYDAATLGNHEFNFGLRWLMRMIGDARHPLACANLRLAYGPLLPPYLLLDRVLRDMRGRRHPIRIGVIGLVPPQVTKWDRSRLGDRVIGADMVETARNLLPQIRAAGADLVVALAHSGIDNGPARPFMENAALHLAALPGIDAVLAGHSHQLFPGPGATTTHAVDPVAGTLCGTPAVMAGYGGSHLGVLDLALERASGQWAVTGHRSEVRAVAGAAGRPPAAPDRTVTSRLTGAHAATLALTRRPIGHSPVPLHSYLAMITDSTALGLVNAAQRATLAEALDGTPHARLPVLSATAPFKAGGRGGPGNYTDIPAGPLSLRHAADLYLFPNTLCGLHMTGAALREWLERAASCFNLVAPGTQDSSLRDPVMPGHDFDVIAGLTYRIDLSQPARYRPDGTLADPTARRIRDLRHGGHPLHESAQFVLATNSYRAFGGGGYPVGPGQTLVHDGTAQVRDILVRYIRQQTRIRPPDSVSWAFHPLPGATAVFETGPGVRRHATEVAALGITDLGDDAAGFARLRLALDAPLASPGHGD